MINLSHEGSHKSFDEYRFKGFHYKDYTPKYWVFTKQVNDTKDKVLVRVSANHVFSYQDHDDKTNYVLKLDQTHCAFFKPWEYFKGLYGNYLLIDKKRYRAIKSNRKYIELGTHSEMLTFAGALELAKKQEHERYKEHKSIMVHKN